MGRGDYRGLRFRRLLGIRVGESEKVISDPAGFTEATQKGAVHSGRVVANRVLT